MSNEAEVMMTGTGGEQEDVAESAASQNPPQAVREVFRKRHVVYLVVNANGLTKIGMSSDPEKRLATLRTASAVALDIAQEWRLPSRAAATALEAKLHGLCRARRAAREWHNLRVSEITPIGDVLMAADPARAGRLAEAICEMRAHEDASARLCAQHARLNPRWNKTRRDDLLDDIEISDSLASAAMERASALGFEPALGRWTKAQRPA